MRTSVRSHWPRGSAVSSGSSGVNYGSTRGCFSGPTSTTVSSRSSGTASSLWTADSHSYIPDSRAAVATLVSVPPSGTPRRSPTCAESGVRTWTWYRPRERRGWWCGSSDEAKTQRPSVEGTHNSARNSQNAVKGLNHKVLCSCLFKLLAFPSGRLGARLNNEGTELPDTGLGGRKKGPTECTRPRRPGHEE